jgi:energy-coupling factor transporter ATP-binding protein EcfA2
MIELSQVSYTYPERPSPAIRELSLDVREGQILSVIGRNASGKSTLCRLAAGILVPGGGTVKIDGLLVGEESSRPEIRRRVALLQQNPESQFVSVTVEREIAFGPESLGFSSGETMHVVEELMSFFGLLEVRSHQPHALSGGQMQKVLLASLLAMKPAYLVLDEPTSYLDPVERSLIGAELKRVCISLGTSIVWVTQFLAEALTCERIAAVEKGRLCFAGTPDEFLDRSDVHAAMGIKDARRLLPSARGAVSRGGE